MLKLLVNHSFLFSFVSMNQKQGEIYLSVLVEVLWEKKRLRLAPKQGQGFAISLRVRCSGVLRKKLVVGQILSLDLKLIQPTHAAPYLTTLHTNQIHQLPIAFEQIQQ
jgi:hypothetical protein